MVLVFVIATSAHSVIATFNEIHFKKMVMKIKNFQILIHYMLHNKKTVPQTYVLHSSVGKKSGLFCFQ